MTNQQNLISLTSNPLFARAQQMAEGKSETELQQIAQNICKEKGLNLDTMLQQFQVFRSMFNK